MWFVVEVLDEDDMMSLALGDGGWMCLCLFGSIPGHLRRDFFARFLRCILHALSLSFIEELRYQESGVEMVKLEGDFDDFEPVPIGTPVRVTTWYLHKIDQCLI